MAYVMCVVFPVLVLPLLTSEKVGHQESGIRECVYVWNLNEEKEEEEPEGR